MPTDETQLESEALDQAWHEIDELVAQIARLSKSDTPKGELYACAVDAVMRGLKAEGAAIWVRATGQRAQLAYQVLPPHIWPIEAQSQRPRLIEFVVETGRAGILPPGCPPTVDPRAANPTNYLLLVCPWSIEGEVACVIEVLKLPGASADVQTGYVRYLEAIGELVTDHERAHRLRDLEESLREEKRFDQFCRLVHGSLDLRTTAYTIANEGRLYLDCDRLSLVAAQDKSFRLLAISGVDVFSRRARAVGLVEQLGKAVSAMGEPLWHPEDAGKQPPQVEMLLSGYLDESHARSLAVVPLTAPVAEGDSTPVHTVGALVIERFYGELDSGLRGKLERLCAHCAMALQNSQDVEGLPFSSVLRKARWLSRNRRPLKIIGILSGLAILAALLCFVPADFRIAVHGELQPRQMQDVFARTDGLVTDIQVQHGQHVAADELLATLRKPQLDYEFKQVLGELQTSRKRLAAIEAERVQTPRDSDEQRRQYSLLAAQGEELRESIRSLEVQYAILQEKQKDLEVRSPMEGEILTWNVKQLLSARPIERGQALMTVGNLSGPWQLELRVPDRQIAHILAAQRELQQPLEVGYVLGTAPAVKLRGTVRQVALRAETPEGEDPYVEVFVDVDRGALPELVPGASVSAAIRCGRRSAGYVWLHDFVDAVRTWLSF